MLDAGRAPQQIGGLTVFFDHADDHRRYVLSEVPRLVANPDPQLSLLVYRGNAAGGLLQFESTLAPTDAQLSAVQHALSQTERPPVLARPDWRSGSVRVAGWLQTTELAPAVLVVGAPSLVGDPVAVIAARLDAPGAALADAALRGNALPTVVIFELDTLGLAGALGVQVEADLLAIHDRLTAEGALTTPYGRARITKTWESAARDNLIRVQIVDESGDVEGRRAEAMRRVGEDLIARMFSPYPPAERPPQLGDGTVAPIELSFRLTMRREEVATSSHWDFRERQAVPIRHVAAASLVDLLGGRDPAAFITFADLSEAPREIVVRAEAELARLGILALEVDLRESADAAVERTVSLTDAQPEARVAASHAGSRLQYRVRARFDPAVTAAADRESAWMDPIGDLVVVSARRIFPPRELTVIAGRVEFDWLDRVELLVRAGGEPARSVSLTAAAPSADAFFPAGGGHAVSITATWHGLRDEPTRSDPPREVTDDVLVLDSPFADSINVLVVPLPLAGVETIVVELRTQFESFVHEKTVSWDAPDRTPRRVGLRRLAGSPRRYAHRIQLIHEDATVDQKPWVETDAPSIAVGADGPVTVRSADVVLLGGGPAARGCFAVELVLEAGSYRTSEVLEGDRDSATLALVAPASAPIPTLTAREFLNSGETRETHWTDPAALTVLPPVAVVAG
jgi:hypothetical protein